MTPSLGHVLILWLMLSSFGVCQDTLVGQFTVTIRSHATLATMS